MLSPGIKKFFSLAIMVLFTGCATSAKNVSPSYVSPFQYQHHKCDQIQQELTGCSLTVQEVARQQDWGASKYGWDTGVGMVVFW